MGLLEMFEPATDVEADQSKIFRLVDKSDGNERNMVWPIPRRLNAVISID